MDKVKVGVACVMLTEPLTLSALKFTLPVVLNVYGYVPAVADVVLIIDVVVVPIKVGTPLYNDAVSWLFGVVTVPLILQQRQEHIHIHSIRQAT